MVDDVSLEVLEALGNTLLHDSLVVGLDNGECLVLTRCLVVKVVVERGIPKRTLILIRGQR